MYACKSELYISLCCINSKLRQHIAWEALCCVEDAFWLQEHSLLANGKTWIALISVMWFVGVRESVLFQNYYYFNAVAGGFFISLHHHTKELEGKVKNNYFSLSWIFFLAFDGAGGGTSHACWWFISADEFSSLSLLWLRLYFTAAKSKLQLKQTKILCLLSYYFTRLSDSQLFAHLFRLFCRGLIME